MRDKEPGMERAIFGPPFNFSSVCIILLVNRLSLWKHTEINFFVLVLSQNNMISAHLYIVNKFNKKKKKKKMVRKS